MLLHESLEIEDCNALLYLPCEMVGSSLESLVLENLSSLQNAPDDIRTRRIIGRGTERQGLYYVDEFAQQGGTAMLAHGSANREAWLWHRRLGHPSSGYLKLLFPKFSHFKDITCESCVLAKSHRQSFRSSDTRVETIFSLVHADVWGPAPILGDHEQASVTVEPITSTVEPPKSPTLQSSPPPPPPVISEVIPETSSDSTIIPPNGSGVDVNAAVDGDTGRYILPLRTTRGIPAKRYSPERVSKKSRYSMANLAKANLTEMARAFEVTLYEEEEIPYTVEEAMKIAHW
ncbi:uncharacterized protein LOC125205368 [Salvia hispanica]|uniref:uncharacterized protein LOC125205368 n=1 Tax=Salvia hispanica TaxID=49212 RepID=UPI0020093F09|nr:uncharacterized protein LOC125205368 [Salvia hispanica]